MLIREILSVSRIKIGIELRSKKAVLEYLSETLGEDCPELSNMDVFEGLLARERLGSTGLGNGIGIPHGRMAGITETKAAFLKTKEAIDFDAVDGQPVDMFFALMVPEESTDEHLKVLSQLAEKFSETSFLERLRSNSEPEGLLKLLTAESS